MEALSTHFLVPLCLCAFDSSISYFVYMCEYKYVSIDRRPSHSMTIKINFHYKIRRKQAKNKEIHNEIQWPIVIVCIAALARKDQHS